MNPFGDLRVVDFVFCGGCVVAVILVLGWLSWSADRAVTHGHRIAHTGESRRRACQRERVR